MKKNYLLHAIVLLAALATAATMPSCSSDPLDETIVDLGPYNPDDPTPWDPPYFVRTVEWSPYGEGEGGRELATGVRYTFTAYFADKVTAFRVAYTFAFYRSNGTRLSEDLIKKVSDKEVSLVFPHPGVFRLVASVKGHPEIESHTFDFEVYDRKVNIAGPGRAPVDSACYFIATIDNPDYPFSTYEYDVEETYWNDPQFVCPINRDPYTFGLTFLEPGDYTVKSWVTGATKTTGEKKVIVEYRPYFKVRRFQLQPPLGQSDKWINRIEFYRDEACTERLPRTEHRIRIRYNIQEYHCDIIDGHRGEPVPGLKMYLQQPINLNAGIMHYELPETTMRIDTLKKGGYRIYWTEYQVYYYTPQGPATIVDDIAQVLK